MANKPKRMHQVQEIYRRKVQGESNRSISRNTGFSRTTINEYLKIIFDNGYSVAEALALPESDLINLITQTRKEVPTDTKGRKLALEGQLPSFRKELGRPGVTRLLLWQEYIKENPGGYCYTQFCYHLAVDKNRQQASMHFEHVSGDCMMVDFAGSPLHYIDIETGEQVACQVLVCILPYSGYTYVQALHSQKQEDFIAGLNNALFFYGGVPRNIKMDNLKSGVKKANRYDPDFTDLMRSFSAHFGINCTTARVAKPKDKPHVEGAVLTAYRRIYAPLRNTTFYSLSELNQAILAQLHTHHEIRFQNKPFTRMELFLEEKQVLAPLPDMAFEKYFTTSAKVQRNYHIQLGQDKHFYSVPHTFIGKTLKVIYTQNTVEIYDNLTRIAFHQRISRSHGYTTLKDHMPANHLFISEQRGWDAEYFKLQSEKIGPQTHAFVNRLLFSRDFIEQSYNACLGVIRLSKKYPFDRLERACERAMLSPNISYRSLEKMLQKGLDKASFAPQQVKIPLHDNIRGKQEYK